MTTDKVLNEANEILTEIDHIINYLYMMRHNDRLTPYTLRIRAGLAALKLKVLRDRLIPLQSDPASNSPPCINISAWIGVQHQ